VPKDERELKHISKPLSYQMFRLIDRERYPILVTYHDVGQGHTGTVYAASNWKRTVENKRKVYVNTTGARTSFYQNGESFKKKEMDLKLIGETTIVRWEHWICKPEEMQGWLESHKWVRVPLFKKDGTEKTWASGKQAFRYVKKC